MTNHIIAICGPKGCGKTTLASLLQKECYVRASFAYPLKKMLIEFVMAQGSDWDFAYRMFYSDLKNTPSDYFLGKTPTYAMQTLGTEWGRDLIHPDIWSEALRKRIEKLIDKGYDIVVDDLRFKSEEKMIRRFEDTTIVRIDRPLYGPGDHQSEQEYLSIGYDIFVDNNGTPDQMFAAFVNNSESYHMSMRNLLRNTSLSENP